MVERARGSSDISGGERNSIGRIEGNVKSKILSERRDSENGARIVESYSSKLGN